MEELNSNPAHFASLGTHLVFATKNGDLYSTTTTKLQVTPTTTNFSGENINYTSNHPGVKSILMDSSQVLIAIASNSSNCNRIELFRLAKIGTSIRNKKLIYKMPGCFNSATTDLNGSGGRLVWADSLHKSVYLSVGMADIWRGDEQITPNQNYGVIINIDLKTGASKLISRGHRNPQGLCVNARGTIIETEQGPEGGDELNVIKNGGHYGWPDTSYGYPYADFPFSPRGRNFGAHTGSYINPIFAWIPSIAASSLICPSNQAPSKWKNYYFMVTLRDESLHVIKIEKNSVLFDERIYLGQRIRDLDWVGLGVLAILTDSGEFIQIRFLER